MNCTNCDNALPIPPLNGASGYAVRQDGSKICYGCADIEQREAMRDADNFIAYLSGDGRHVTTWSGGTLGEVIRSKPCKLTRVSYTHSVSSYRSLRVRDVHGNVWVGRGSPGIVLKLRKVAQ